MPAEIVIIAGDDRYDEDEGGREPLKPHELLNAAGRAGMSAQGTVMLIPGKIVTVEDIRISQRWWTLKEEIFSKGDQCLKIEDPLEHFLDTLQDRADELGALQLNVLYKFKPDILSETETKRLLGKSLYAYRAAQRGTQEQFDLKSGN